MKVTDEERALFLLTPIEFNQLIAELRKPPEVIPRLAEFLRENRVKD